MKMRVSEFEGVGVDAANYALLAPVIERTREMLAHAAREGGFKVGPPLNGARDSDFGHDSFAFPSPVDPYSEPFTISVHALSRTLNMLLVQAGSQCHFDHPASNIEHCVGPFGNYYQCGHSDDPHYWDENGNRLDARP